ncbi:gp062 [Rhodococcus phage ReqiDocB7]|nr:gp062 [Rhodococcus phage ReqiDocB7]ADD80848.1 gp062 [Rhodococcus phage ReqiDocB7]
MGQSQGVSAKRSGFTKVDTTKLNQGMDNLSKLYQEAMQQQRARNRR